jgi:putative MATE family efflux protein
MDYLKKRQLILEGNLTKTIIMLSLPLMINNFIQTIYNITDTYFVGKLGTTSIAAIQFVWPLTFLMLSFATGIGVAATALISQSIGAHDSEKAIGFAGQTLLFNGLFSILFGLGGYLIAPWLLTVLGASGPLYQGALSFLRVMFLGMPTLFSMVIFAGIKAGEGDNKTPMIFGAISVVLNIILDPLFIFTFGLGIKGAAIATVISRGLIGFYAISTLFGKNNALRINPARLKFQYEEMKSLLRMGIPSSIGQSTAAFGFTIMNIFIISLGESTLTAFTIGNRISGLVMMPALGIGSAISAIIGQNLGAGNIERARSAVKRSSALSTIFLIVMGGVLIALSENVVKIFSSDLEVIYQGTHYMRLITMTLPLVGFFQIFIGTFQGSGHTKISMFLMIARLWLLRIPMLYIFKNFTDFRPDSVWTSMILSNVIICIMGALFLRFSDWTKLKEKKSTLARSANV